MILVDESLKEIGESFILVDESLKEIGESFILVDESLKEIGESFIAVISWVQYIKELRKRRCTQMDADKSVLDSNEKRYILVDESLNYVPLLPLTFDIDM